MKSFVNALTLFAASAFGQSAVDAPPESVRGQLLLSVELTQNGERQPSYLFSYASDPSQEFDTVKELTQLGADSQYANGQGLREFFNNSGNFLSSAYD